MLKYLYGTATVGNGSFSNEIHWITFFFGDSKSPRTSKWRFWFKSYDNFAEKKWILLIGQSGELVCGVSVNNGAYPV